MERYLHGRHERSEWLSAGSLRPIGDPRKKSPFGLSFLGATEATTFELISKLAEWLYENDDPNVFKLPITTVKQRSQQMAEATYNY